MAALYQRNFDHRFFNPPLRQGFRRRYLHSGFGEQVRSCNRLLSLLKKVESPKFTFPQWGTRKDDLDIHDNRVCVTKQIDKFKPDHCSPGPAIFLHNGSMGDQEKSQKTNPAYCRFGKEPRFREIKQTPGPGHYDY